MDREAVIVETRDSRDIDYLCLSYSIVIPVNIPTYSVMVKHLCLDWDNAVLLAVL